MPAASLRPHRLRRIAAVVATAAVALTGAVALAPAAPAEAAYPDTFDPFAISGRYTIYARDNASLGNQETEGTIAVGDTLTKPGGGQYTIIHVSAGTADYTLPTVDGDPTRLLVSAYSPDSDGILAITSAGTSQPELLGDLKMVERDGPFQPFARADWLRLNTNPANADQTPLIDATHQSYPDDAAPPASAVGGGSIYTSDTAPTAVADYVEAGAEASYEQAAQCFADIADPTSGAGYPVGIAEDAGSRVVLEPLSADQPNVVDYTDIAGAALIQFSPGPQPGVANPLVIRVPAGTTEVAGARADPQGAYSPYIVWDLSAVSGEVTMTAAEGRIDGSIYAPDADVTVDAAPLDGQIIGRDVTTLGGEVHSFMFAGRLTCTAADDGTFRIHKQVTGIDPDDPRLADVAFTVEYTATTPEGETSTGSLVLPATGEWVDAGARFPTGTEVVFDEVAPPDIPGYEWDDPVITPDPLTIESGEPAEVTVTNTGTELRATFSVTKNVIDAEGEPLDVSGTVPVHWRAIFAGDEIDDGTLDVPLDGTPVGPGTDFPVGTVVVLTEDTSVPPPAGYEWESSGWDPGRVVQLDDDATLSVTLTNMVVPADADRTISIVKSAEGDAADPAFGYAVSYNTADGRTSTPVTVGEPIVLADVDPDADTLELAEPVPTSGGQPVDVAAWDPPVFTVTVDGEQTTYTAGGFEGDVPLDQAIVDIPISTGQNIEIDVANSRKTGTFTLAKQFAGIDAADLPADLLFPVDWTATDPFGTVSTGTVALPVDGTPVSPRDAAGEPVQFPYDTEITFTEQTPPSVPGVTWDDVSFDPAALTIGAGDAATVAAAATNTASVVTGTFQVAKQLAGVRPDDLSIDTISISYLAVPPGGGFETGTFPVPVDGTPAGPTDDSGNAIEFPIGTHVLLAESPPGDEVLPDDFRWGSPLWSPSRLITITGDPDVIPTATVTDSAVEYAQLSLTKQVDDEAGLAPADTEFTIDWWLDDEAQPPITLTEGQSVTSDQFLVGSIVEAAERPAPDVAGATWQTPVWTVDGQPLPVDDDGRVVVPVSSRGGTMAFALTNTLTADAAVAGFSVEKSVAGAAAAQVPDDTVFPIEYRVDGADAVAASVGVDEPFRVTDLPADATVEVREGTPPVIEGVEWGEPAWTIDGQSSAADANGWVAVPLRADATVALTLQNTATALSPPEDGGSLPVTGGSFSPWLVLFALVAIALGALVVWRVRRRA